MPRHRLNLPVLYRALDVRRGELGLLWKDVAAEAGVSRYVLSRMAADGRPDADALCSLLVWLGMPLEGFVRSGIPPTE